MPRRVVIEWTEERYVQGTVQLDDKDLAAYAVWLGSRADSDYRLQQFLGTMGEKGWKDRLLPDADTYSRQPQRCYLFKASYEDKALASMQDFTGWCVYCRSDQHENCTLGECACDGRQD